jgi:thymidylate synthase
MIYNNVVDVRREFANLFIGQHYTSINRESTMTNLVGSKTIEILGANFIAYDDSIFGDVNWSYVNREEEWYESMSLSVNDFPGGAPPVWKAVACKDGLINSNYGWCINHPDNNSQLEKVIAELKKNPESRRAIIIYTRPSMWNDYNVNGRSDFMCTNAVQYLIRDNQCHAVVQMRSNDAIIGYRNDKAWQQHVLNRVASELKYVPGDIYWQVGSLHLYERDFYLVDHYVRTGEHAITKAKYRELYPGSIFCPEVSK